MLELGAPAQAFCFVELFARARLVTLELKHQAERVVRGRQIRPQVNRATQGGRRSSPVLPGFQHRAEGIVRIRISRVRRNRSAKRRRRPVQLALMPVDDAHRVVGFRAGLDGERAFELGERFRQTIRASEDERQVVARESVAGIELQQLPEGLNRSLQVLFGLGEAQREVPIRIPGSLRDECARSLHRLGALAGLDEREDQVVRGLAKRRALGERAPVGVDGRVERADALERLTQPILHVGIPRRESRRFPEKGERSGVVPPAFELDRAVVRLPGTSRRVLRGDDGRVRRQQGR